MSILIKGMEMPKSCIGCKLRVAVGCCGNLPHNTRMPLCPLVELPPHGRLIDADAVLQEYGISSHPTECYGCKHKGAIGCGGYEWSILCEAVSDAPAIIEAEEKDNDIN